MRTLSPEQEKSYKLTAAAFELVKHKLPEPDQNEASEFIYKHNEWGIGIEHIMYTLIECNISISQSEFESIEAACKSMGLSIISGLKAN